MRMLRSRWKRLAFWPLVAAVLVLSADFASTRALADEQYEFIVISKARQKIRVAVPDFRGVPAPTGEGVETELTGKMRDTVELSGLFELIDPSGYPEPVVAGAAEDYPPWQLIRTDLLIRGEVSRLDADRYQVELRCYDVKRKEQVLGKRYTGKRDVLNRTVLKFMDEIMGYLTPKKGTLDSRIAYVTDQGRVRRTEIFVMDTDGSHNVPLTRNNTLNLSPAWSPDGRYVVYTGYRARNPDLYIADLVDQREWRFFSREGLNSSAEFSPDGRMIAFSREGHDGNIDIYVIEFSGRNLRRLTSSWANEVSPTWSPDGKFLAFVSDRTGSPQIYLLDLSRGQESPQNPAIRLSDQGNYNTSPAWSPDGRFIAYTGRVGGQFDLFLIDMAGGSKNVRRMTATAADEEDPAWSPDSRFLVYSSNKYGNYDIFLMSIYGGLPKRITTSNARERMPAWSPRAEP